MNESQKKAIKRTIDIFEHDAEELREHFFSDGGWDSTNRKDEYTEFKSIAKELRTMLEG